jgi:hypothetical protein
VTLTYVYCIVESVRRPRLRRGLRPVPGATGIATIPAGLRRWLVVSHVPAGDYDEDAVARGLRDIDWVAARAVAHERVVEQFLRARAVLPMQLFTLFTSDDRALAYVSHNRRRIDRVLARVEQQHEWGVRFTFEDTGPAPARRPRGARAARAETGTSYLTRKRDQREVDRIRLTRARTDGNRAFRAMSRQATAARRRKATEQGASRGSRLLVDAAFLVPVARTAAFRAALRREARALGASGVAVALTGPWPPYNFIDSGKRRP